MEKDTFWIHDFELRRAERRALSLALDLGVQLDPRIHPLDFAISLYNEHNNQKAVNKSNPRLVLIISKIQEYEDIFNSLKSRHLIE